MCSSCGRSAAMTVTGFPTQFNGGIAAQIVSTGPCAYTRDQLLLWQAKLNCFKQGGYFRQFGVAPSQLNAALGTVLSAINYPNDPCYYQRDLDKAQNLIMFIISTNAC